MSEELQRLYNDYLDAIEEEKEAASRSSFLAEELGVVGIDVDNPPDWLD